MPAIVRLTKLTLLITATCFLVIFLIWAAFVRSGSLAVLGQMCQWIGVLLIGTGLLSLTGEWTVERNPPYQYPESAGESTLVKKRGHQMPGSTPRPAFLIVTTAAGLLLLAAGFLLTHQ
jgi:hypothetical protein